MTNAINSNVLSAFDVFRYKKKYLKIMKLSKFLPFLKASLLINLRDDIDFNWSFVINNKSNDDLCNLYEKINSNIEKE